MYTESFNRRPWDGLLNGEFLDTLEEARTIIEDWRRHCNHLRPHRSPGSRPPALEAWLVDRVRPAPRLVEAVT